jgi:pimeloyl-ACP methyl ester carboxylesterase
VKSTAYERGRKPSDRLYSLARSRRPPLPRVARGPLRIAFCSEPPAPQRDPLAPQRRTYNHRRIDRLAADLDEVLTALNVTAPLTLVGHSMGAMVALAYLSRRASERPVDPHGLVLVATAAGKLAQRGLGRLLGTPATPALFKVIEHTPDPALKMLAGPVCAALSRWCSCGPAQRATLAATAAEALATTPVSTAVGFLPTLCDYEVYRTLGSVRAQTVVVSGGADPLTPPVHSRELADGIPGAATCTFGMPGTCCSTKRLMSSTRPSGRR